MLREVENNTISKKNHTDIIIILRVSSDHFASFSHFVRSRKMRNFASFSLHLFSRKNAKFCKKFAKCERKFSRNVSFAENPNHTWPDKVSRVTLWIRHATFQHNIIVFIHSGLSVKHRFRMFKLKSQHTFYSWILVWESVLFKLFKNDHEKCNKKFYSKLISCLVNMSERSQMNPK